MSGIEYANNFQTIQFYVTTTLSIVTIVVLIFTCSAALKQARAAEKLTESTEQQIRTSQMQADAAKNQNAIARRQITESVRPLLLFSEDLVPGENAIGYVRNDGIGPALDAWWYYGQLKTEKKTKRSIASEVIASRNIQTVEYNSFTAASSGITLIATSLSGTTCATEITWSGGAMRCRYVPDVEILLP